jgi:hypothetical protein
MENSFTFFCDYTDPNPDSPCGSYLSGACPPTSLGNNRLQVYCEHAGIQKRLFPRIKSNCIKFTQAAGWTPEEAAKLIGDTLRVI